MFNRLIGYIGGTISGMMSSLSQGQRSYESMRQRQRQRELYNQAQLDILQAEENQYRYSEDGYDLNISRSMSSYQSSFSSETTNEDIESNALGTPYFASLEERMKKMGLEEDEFFKKEEFDV